MHVKYVNLSKVEKVGDDFFSGNREAKEISITNLIITDDCFFYRNNAATKINFPKLIKIGFHYFHANLNPIVEEEVWVQLEKNKEK